MTAKCPCDGQSDDKCQRGAGLESGRHGDVEYAWQEERGATRLDDQTSEASMEQRKKEGYF